MVQLHRDPRYQALQQKKDEARQARVAVNQEVAAPIVTQLRAVGFDVSSIADLHNKRFEYPQAVPILLAWLSKVQNLDVKQDIVRCLSVP